MRAEKVIAAEEVVTVAAIATGDLLAQGQARSLPQPRRLIAAFLLYGGLSLVASFGQQAARVAAAVGGVLMLVQLVLGPGGNALVQLLQRGAGFAQTAPGSKPTAPKGTTAATGAPHPNQSTIDKVLGVLKGVFDFLPGLPLP